MRRVIHEDYDSVAVVGALSVEERFLVIRRSEKVIAPGKICFPGGSIEPGESIDRALIREFQEEVGLEIDPLTELWTNVTPWRCKVHWWSVECNDPDTKNPNRDEVADVYWLTAKELLANQDLLESNRQFLELFLSGEINL